MHMVPPCKTTEARQTKSVVQGKLDLAARPGKPPGVHDLQRRLHSLKIPKTLYNIYIDRSFNISNSKANDLPRSTSLDSSGLGLRIPAFTYQIHISLDKEPSYFHRRSLVTMTFRRPRPLALRLCRPPSHRKRSNHSRPSCIVSNRA